MHTKPPIARFANGESFSGGSVIAAVRRLMLPMSPELETLDQLLGGDLPVSIVRGFFPNEERFVRAMASMLDANEIRLLNRDGEDVPHWHWRNVLSIRPESFRLRITEEGAQRIA